MEPDCNVEITIYHCKVLGTWEIRDFVVVYQPEAWGFKQFQEALTCAVHMYAPPEVPPDIIKLSRWNMTIRVRAILSSDASTQTDEISNKCFII